MATTIDDTQRKATIAHKQEAKKDTWQTPPKLIDIIESHVNIDLDPCAGKDTMIGDENIRLPRNGKAYEWSGTVFVNPPFSNKSDWLQKAVEEYQSGNTDLIIFLTPDSTDVKSWYHKYIVEHAEYTWFSYGRIDYIDPTKDEEENEKTSGATFGTALSFFGDVPESLLKELNENGDLVKRKLFDE